MSIRNILIIVLLILCAIRLIYSATNEVYKNSINCENDVCVLISKSSTGKIIQEKNINLKEIISFSYNKNSKKSRKRHIVYDINMQMKNDNNLKLTETPYKTPYEMENIITNLNKLLNDKTLTKFEF